MWICDNLAEDKVEDTSVYAESLPLYALQKRHPVEGVDQTLLNSFGFLQLGYLLEILHGLSVDVMNIDIVNAPLSV